MSYLDDIEKELRDQLFPAEDGDIEWSDQIVAFVRQKLLESFKNGAQAGRKQMGKTQTPKQKSPTGNHGKA